MRHDEDTLQMACVKWFSYQHRGLSRLLHHSPNGGWRNLREAARFKAMGVRAGFPDLILMIANSEYHALCIELKTAKGRQSDSQKAFEAAVTAQGYKYIICRSFEDFQNQVTNYLKCKEK